MDVESRKLNIRKQIEELIRQKILDNEDAKLITGLRIENVTSTQSESIEGYMHHILYEVEFLKHISRKVWLMGMEECSEIEFVIANYINELFQEALRKYPNERELWVVYNKFCHQVTYFQDCIGSMYVDILQSHISNPDLFLWAAMWEFDRKGFDQARQHIKKGLEVHSESEFLYTEALHMELRMTEAIINQCKIGEKKECDKKIFDCHHSEEILKAALEKVPMNPKFLIGFMDLARMFPFSSQLLMNIEKEFKARYEKEEQHWDKTARQNFHMISPTESLGKVGDIIEVIEIDDDDNELTEKEKDKQILEEIKKCVEVYKIALDNIPSENMWTHYVEGMLEMSKNTNKFADLKRKCLLDALIGAHLSRKLKCKYYIKLIETLHKEGDRESLKSVLLFATDQFKDSMELWEARLRFHILSDDRTNIGKLLKFCDEYFIDSRKTCPLWKMVIKFYQVKYPEDIDELFKRAPAVLRPMYLEWIVLTRDIVEAWKEYEVLRKLQPFCLELHQMMISLENNNPYRNLKKVRKCYEYACQQFGTENMDVWLDFIKYEHMMDGDANAITVLYETAVQMLEPSQKEQFKEEFAHLQF